MVLGFVGLGAETTITLAGSSTVQPLAEKLGNAFTESKPDVRIDVSGGGSSVGIKSVADGIVDIGMSSRELRPDEPQLIEHLIAKDAIAIVVHPGNSVSNLSMEQLRKIYTGEITNWNQVGGAAGAIIVVAREEGSGTRDAFDELVMQGSLIKADAILQTSNGMVRTAVSITPSAIGFLSLAYTDSSVKVLAINGVECTVENCQSGAYPLVRPLYLLTKGEPEGLVKEFIDFCLSPEGQRIVEEEGYIPVIVE